MIITIKPILQLAKKAIKPTLRIRRLEQFRSADGLSHIQLKFNVKSFQHKFKK